MSNQKTPESSPTNIVPVTKIIGRDGKPVSGKPKPAAETTGPVRTTLPDTGTAQDWSALAASDDVYELLEPIGVGGMGSVYVARDKFLGRTVAIKILNDDHEMDSIAAVRFLQESQIHAQLQHPCIPPLYGVGRFGTGRPYIAMKYVKGRILDDLLQDRDTPTTDFAYFLEIYEQVCQVIAYAQAKGVVHRDLKPHNILVSDFGQVWVIDWGLAKVVEDAQDALRKLGLDDDHGTTEVTVQNLHETAEGMAIGTPAFIAPEQASGSARTAPERGDVFGLGALLCVILTGKPPYSGTASGVWNQARAGDIGGAYRRLDRSLAPQELIDLAKACLARDPAERPNTASQVAKCVTRCRASIIEEACRRQAKADGGAVGRLLGKLRFWDRPTR